MVWNIRIYVFLNWSNLQDGEDGAAAKKLIPIPHSRIRNQAMNGYQLHSFSGENIRLVLNSVFIEPNQLLPYFRPQFLNSYPRRLQAASLIRVLKHFRTKNIFNNQFQKLTISIKPGENILVQFQLTGCSASIASKSRPEHCEHYRCSFKLERNF